MKQLLLGIDLTDKNNDIMNGECFVRRRLSAPLEQTYDRLVSAEEQFREKRRLPAFVRGVKWVAGMTAFAIPCLLLEECSSGGSRRKPANPHAYTIIILIGVLMFLLWLILTAVEVSRIRNQEESADFRTTRSEGEAFQQSAKEDLGVPESAVPMDLLCSKYHWVDGKIYSVTSRWVWYYGNIEFSTWRQGDCLCLADTTMRLEIPLDAFRGAEWQNCGYNFSAWNKASPYRSPEFKPYRISFSNGALWSYRYLAVRLNYEKEDYELRVPGWEAESLRVITGWDFPAMKEKKKG